MSANFLNELKVGDPVIIASGSWFDTRRVVKVIKRDKVKIVVEGGGSFSAKHGRTFGYGREGLQEATPTAIAEINAARRRAAAVRRIESVKLASLSIEVLEAAADILAPRGADE